MKRRAAPAVSAELDPGLHVVNGQAAQLDAETLSVAARDDDPPVRRSRAVADLADDIAAFARLPRLSWGFEQLDRVAPFPAGSVVVILGATGRGKTAFLLQAARCHAQHLGPVLIVSAELAGAVAGARMVAQATGLAWLEVLGGALDVAQMRAALAVETHDLRIVDEVGPDIMCVIDLELAAFGADFPGKPALVVLDYVQLVPGAGIDPRERIGAVMVALRKLAVKHSAGVMVISKAGRSAARALRTGEAIGVELTEAGAETNAIEHEAVAQVALGAMRPIEGDPNGAEVVDVSVTKARFGQADKVVPLRFEGARGRFSAAGDAVSATERRAAVKVESNDARMASLEYAAAGHAQSSPKPLSKADLMRAMGKGSNVDKAAAIARLLDAQPPRLVYVRGPGVKKLGGSWPVWTPDRVTEIPGFDVVPKVVADA